MNENGPATVSGKGDYHHKQKQVDERFNAGSTFWRDVYQRTDLFGIVIRQRQVIALNYVEELSLPKTARVLEIGCGAGFMAIALAQNGFIVKAVDHASAMIELTQRHAKQKGLDNRVHVSIEDAHELTFEDCSFDLIVALGVIGWLHDLRTGLVEIARVLKPGGYFVLSMRNPHRWWVDPPLLLQGIMKNVLERAGLQSPSYVARAHYYSIKELVQNLYEADLILKKNTSIGFGPFALFDHSIFSDNTNVIIHQKLQQYANSRCSFLRMAGAQYILLTAKRK
jgi:ubiquinone/menaquinone biosynthesis C-methylase UbiE